MYNVGNLVKELSDKHGRRRDSLMPILQGIVERHNYLTDEAMVEVARELDIGESLLHNWLARYRLRNGAEAWQAEQTVEITRLKRLLAQRDEEVAILKKAAAYFARESR